MTQDINKHITIIDNSIKWAKEYGKDSFPYEILKNLRRKLKRISNALEENCSVAAYGESQVGKSYLMSSLLSSPNSPFVIVNKGKEFSFIDQINPSGGNNSKTESTGVITRFRLGQENSNVCNYVRVRNLSVVDIILLIVDSYYNDVKPDQDKVLMWNQINAELSGKSILWSDKNIVQNQIDEDDVKDIGDYIKDVIGSNASNIYRSDFVKIVAPIISYVSYDRWVDIFSLLWNNNEEFSRLFSVLIEEYKKINFQNDIYVPFEAVLRENGTLLKIDWLDTVCGNGQVGENEKVYTDIYDSNGNILVKDFHKGYLSALIAELTFELPVSLAKERQFLHKIDLLDFPGARSREKIKEKDVHTELPRVLRRGKVAYLFNKYSRDLRIGGLFFCHHNDQKSEATLGDTINSWIEENIGKTPEERTTMLKNTKGIAPLFLIATKFNLELERGKMDLPDNREKLKDHWKRFDVVLPEIINPNTWFDEWVTPDPMFPSSAFQNIYPLRDFYYSGKNQVFDGYSDGLNGMKKSEERNVHIHSDYKNYFDDLRESFIRHKFVKKHFANPEQTWNDVATVNNDGSKAIIRNLDSIASVLEEARRKKYRSQLLEIKQEIHRTLSAYFEPEDIEAKNLKIKQIVSDIKMSLFLNVGKKPEIFGRIIDNLMVPVGDIRNIAYDIIICHTDTPKDFTMVNFIRQQVGIKHTDNREVCIQKLCNFFGCDSDRLDKELQKHGCTIDDVISEEIETLTTVAGVVAKHIVDYWYNYISNKVNILETILPHSEEVVCMLVSLLKKMEIREKISNRIERYCKMFSVNEQPNVIADYASLTLNNFVSSVGSDYLKDSEIEQIRQKSNSCGIVVNLEPSAWKEVRKPQPLEQTLIAFDEASDIALVDREALMKLPLWGNFQRWSNLVSIGLLYASDISNVNPKANAQIKELIDSNDALYKD